MLETEQEILKLVSESKDIPSTLVSKYIELHAHFRDKSKVPFGFTALVYNNLTMHPTYHQSVLIPLLDAARFNAPLSTLLKTDVYTDGFLNDTLSDPGKNQDIIDKNKHE